MRIEHTADDPGPTTERVATIRRLLLAAYDAGKRSLPWRHETDPYRIWVSEVMLQQTQVDTVVPFYERWMVRFPTLLDLAQAGEGEVLRAWQGLGYYARARRLHQGARLVRERHGGVLPSNSEELRELPGVGEYTAGAVASIAFGEVVPAVDGNVRRVLSRLFDLAAAKPSELHSLAAVLVDTERPGDFNQSLMELGAITCVPRSPECRVCPLEQECLARRRGTVGERPVRKTRKPPAEMDVAVLVAMVRDMAGDHCFLMRKRPDRGLLAGMWEFPARELSSDPHPTPGLDEDRHVEARARNALGELLKDTAAALVEQLGLPAGSEPAGLEARLSPLAQVPHTFSHLKVRYHPFRLVLEGNTKCLPWRGDREGEGSSMSWFRVSDLDHLPLPVAQQKILRSARDVTPT